jgi:SAM-dependent methyltransferase
VAELSSKTAGEWSKGPRLEHLDKDREGLLDDEFIERVARRLVGIEPGMTLVDVGCGLGYLGEVYHPFAMPEGRYIGVDIDQALLDMAAERVAGTGRESRCEFLQGDAGAIPLDDGAADVTMCQTLLMHVSDPLSIVCEMRRVTRPGGKILAMEPDHRGWTSFNSVHEPTLEEDLRRVRIHLMMLEGRRRLGYGDWSIGSKLPYLFHQAGLTGIEGRIADDIRPLIPPYDSRKMRLNIERVKRWLAPGRMKHWREEAREHFAAAGGDMEELEREWEETDKRNAELLAALERKEAVVTGGSSFFAVVGTVPKE